MTISLLVRSSGIICETVTGPELPAVSVVAPSAPCAVGGGAGGVPALP